MGYNVEYQYRFYKRIVPDIRAYEHDCIYECTAKGCKHRTLHYGAMRIHAIKKHGLKPIKKMSTAAAKKQFAGIPREDRMYCEYCNKVKHKKFFTSDPEGGMCDECFNEKKKDDDEEEEEEEKESEEEQTKRIEEEAANIRAAEEEKKRIAAEEELRRAVEKERAAESALLEQAEKEYCDYYCWGNKQSFEELKRQSPPYFRDKIAGLVDRLRKSK